MAATAVYTSVRQITKYDSPAATKDQPVIFLNISATTAAFVLRGGRYSIKCKASTYGTVTLQNLLDDATTWATADTAFAADGFHGAVDLPPGSYRFAVA